LAALPKDCSPEQRVFQLYFSKLVACVPSSLATEFYSNDLISRELHKAIVDTIGLSESQKVKKILLAVEGQMVANPSVFHKFVAVMRTDPSLVHIADVLSDRYSK